MNMTLLRFVTTILLLSPLTAFSAEITYAFDTVTAVNMSHNNPSVTGIEKDTGNTITVSFVDNTNVSYRYIVNRCVPVFLTVLEKPGRYYLYVTVDPAELYIALKSCQIEVKI